MAQRPAGADQLRLADYETVKLRLLNGAHSMLAYLGRDLTDISEAVHEHRRGRPAADG